jgi:N-acetylneuraminate synthase
MRTKIIAEIGVNHDGDLDRALALVDCCARLGVDYAKFQIFSAAKLVTDSAERADYQVKAVGVGSQRDMLRKLELSEADFRCIHDRCRSVGIKFLATPFDYDAACFLIEDLNCDTVKIGSGDMDNAPLLMAIASRGADMIVSTGMSDEREIEQACKFIAYGRTLHRKGLPFGPTSNYPSQAILDLDFNHSKAEGLTLLHCTSEYPAAHAALNMQAISAMFSQFSPIPLGFSDHSTDDVAAIMAVTLGAVLIERHLTYDRAAAGPDHAASLDEAGFARMIAAVSLTEAALGQNGGRKSLSVGEQAIRRIARKKVVAGRNLKAGEILTLANTTLKRAPRGIAAGQMGTVLGKQLRADVSADTPIDEAMIS